MKIKFTTKDYLTEVFDIPFEEGDLFPPIVKLKDKVYLLNQVEKKNDSPLRQYFETDVVEMVVPKVVIPCKPEILI